MIEAQLRVALPTIGRRGRAVGGEAGTCQCNGAGAGRRKEETQICSLRRRAFCGDAGAWRKNRRRVEEEQDGGDAKAYHRSRSRRRSVPVEQEEEAEGRETRVCQS